MKNQNLEEVCELIFWLACIAGLVLIMIFA